ncbi:Chromadorea ALT family protein [Acanthocheilonema viteae]
MKVLLQLLFVFGASFLTVESRLILHDKTAGEVNNAANADEQMPEIHLNATFISTDGIMKRCTSHADCYDMREPIDWCRLADNQQWTDKGCHCASLNKCVIERLTKLGSVSSIRNYALCAPKKSWKCPPSTRFV